MSLYSNNKNVFKRHRKIFEAMKLKDNTTVMIITSGKRFEHPKIFLSGQDYVKAFHSKKTTPKATKDRRLFEVVSSIRIDEFK